MSWGGDLTDDSAGPTRSFPTLSLITGLLANAMGWERYHHQKLQELHDNAVIASRIDRDPAPANLTDYQNAQLRHDEQGWTTYGYPQGRDGDRSKYEHPHPTSREYLQDCLATVALTLHQEPQLFSTEEIFHSLSRPRHPLFIGRRTCIPSTQIYAGTIEADSPLDALFQIPLFWTHPGQPEVRLQWSPDQSPDDPRATPKRYTTVRDVRDWRSRLHGGHRTVIEGYAPASAFPPDESR